MNRYSFQSEADYQTQMIDALLSAKRLDWVQLYCQNGWDGIAAQLKDLPTWLVARVKKVILLEFGAVLKCVDLNFHFFDQMIGSDQGDLIRPTLSIQEPEFENLWTEVLEALLQKTIDQRLSDKQKQMHEWLKSKFETL